MTESQIEGRWTPRVRVFAIQQINPYVSLFEGLSGFGWSIPPWSMLAEREDLNIAVIGDWSGEAAPFVISLSDDLSTMSPWLNGGPPIFRVKRTPNWLDSGQDQVDATEGAEIAMEYENKNDPSSIHRVESRLYTGRIGPNVWLTVAWVESLKLWIVPREALMTDEELVFDSEGRIPAFLDEDRPKGWRGY